MSGMVKAPVVRAKIDVQALWLCAERNKAPPEHVSESFVYISRVVYSASEFDRFSSVLVLVASHVYFVM